jgi:membrane-associated PAP2 superfamily phosphatase
MVKRAPRPVNNPAPADSNLLLQEQALIWLTFGGLAALLYATGAENTLARALYFPENAISWFLRQYGALPGGVLAFLALLALFLPNLWNAKTLLYRSCATLVIAAVIGCGLINQVMIQEVADRARPRETILAAPSYTPPAEFTGNSMPSGHAAMGFVLAAPFFVLRRKKPGQARAFLAAGLAAGGIVGVGRIMLGAHFASDILIAGAIALSTASLAAFALGRWPRIPRRYIAAVALAAALGVMLGNHFKLKLEMPLPQPFRQISLPCDVKAVYHSSYAVPTLEVALRGYGAPVSQLKLVNRHGIIRLQKHYGLYHGLSCAARLNLPIGPYE